MDTNINEEVETVDTEEMAGAQDQEHEEVEDPRKQLKYSDDDVDNIVKRRLAKERKRLAKQHEQDTAVNELDERERAITLRELKADAKDRLIEDDMPTSLAELLNYEDKQSFNKSYEDVTKIFAEAVRVQVAKKLSHTPRRGEAFKSDPLKQAFARKK